MAEITAALVGQLREMTNAGMMECKKALTEAKGDLNTAVDILRKKGAASAAKKASRETKDGIIARQVDAGGKVGVLVEVNCETDFVAKNADFRAFCDQVAKNLAANPKADVEPLRAALVAKIGENMKVSRFERFEARENAVVAAYVHQGDKIGVLVEAVVTKPETLLKEEFKQLVRDITLQIAALNPVAITPDQINPAVIEKEKEIAREKHKGKPAQVLENKILPQRMKDFFAEICLLEQTYVKATDKSAVKDYIASVAKQTGDTITIARFVRFQVGESFGA